VDYGEFEKAVDIFGILTRMSKKDLKSRYLKLSKKYHPDLNGGNDEKFIELKKSYDLLCEYIDNYRYSFEIEEFKHQFPSFTSYKNWIK